MALLIAGTADAERPPDRRTPLHWYILFVHITQATVERRRKASERQFAGTSALAAEPLHVETLSNPWKKAGITAPLWLPGMPQQLTPVQTLSSYVLAMEP